MTTPLLSLDVPQWADLTEKLPLGDTIDEWFLREHPEHESTDISSKIQVNPRPSSVSRRASRELNERAQTPLGRVANTKSLSRQKSRDSMDRCTTPVGRFNKRLDKASDRKIEARKLVGSASPGNASFSKTTPKMATPYTPAQKLDDMCILFSSPANIDLNSEIHNLGKGKENCYPSISTSKSFETAKSSSTADTLGRVESCKRKRPEDAGKPLDLKAIIQAHNDRVQKKPKVVYEPRKHCARNVAEWQAWSGKDYYSLSVSEREAANWEIEQYKINNV
eukprot:Platyproteum_vivax@DN292_c0_g1_i1.p1